ALADPKTPASLDRFRVCQQRQFGEAGVLLQLAQLLVDAEAVERCGSFRVRQGGDTVARAVVVGGEGDADGDVRTLTLPARRVGGGGALADLGAAARAEA